MLVFIVLVAYALKCFHKDVWTHKLVFWSLV